MILKTHFIQVAVFFDGVTVEYSIWSCGHIRYAAEMVDDGFSFPFNAEFMPYEMMIDDSVMELPSV